MPTNTENSKRIAKNTMFLYIRMIFLLVVNLYASRIILNTLGVEDYGIYNAVGGFVAMFTILSGSLSNAISRHLTFELGREDHRRLKKTFANKNKYSLLVLPKMTFKYFIVHPLRLHEG